MSHLHARYHDDVIKWIHFPCYWPFVRGYHWSQVNSPDKGQRRRAFMFSLTYGSTNGWVNNRDTGDLWRHRSHFCVTVIWRVPPPPPISLIHGSRTTKAAILSSKTFFICRSVGGTKFCNCWVKITKRRMIFSCCLINKTGRVDFLTLKNTDIGKLDSCKIPDACHKVLWYKEKIPNYEYFK